MRVGKRKVTGVVLAETEQAPEGVSLRPIEQVLDREPVLPAELLELAAFAADYYLAPIGEVVQTLLPSGPAAVG